MSQEKIDLIYDILKTHSNNTNNRLAAIEKDLREHKEGVIQCRTRLEWLEARENVLETKVSELEQPKRALIMIKIWSIWVVSVGAAMGLLYKLWGDE